MKALPARFVFQRKTSEHVKRTIHSQVPFVSSWVPPGSGKDFIQSYSPTPRAASIRLLLGVAVKDDMSLHLFHVAQAFVQADLPGEKIM